MKFPAFGSPMDCFTGLMQVIDSVKQLAKHFTKCSAAALLVSVTICPEISAATLPEDSTKKYDKRVFFKSMTWGYPDRAADFEENLFKDAQLHFNVSLIHSAYNLSPYRTDEWLLQENELQLLTPPNLNDPLRKFNQTRLAMELRGSFLFFYLGLGMVLPSTYRKFEMGQGHAWYSNDSTRYFGEIRKGSFLKAGMNLHFRKWLLYGGIRSYKGINQSSIMAENLKTGKITKLKGTGNDIFNSYLEFGLQFRNFTIGYERALNIDFAGAESNSIFIGYNLFDFRNYNEKRIPR